MLSYVKSILTVYTTSKLVQIKSKTLAIIYTTLLVTVWVCYLGSYELDLRKIYQKTCQANGAVTVRAKGALSTLNLNDSKLDIPYSNLYKRVWDHSDVILQSDEGFGFAVVTNVVITPNQTRGVCAKQMPLCTKPNCLRRKKLNCTKDEQSPTEDGIMTGRYSKVARSCQVFAWCPIQNDILPFNGTKAVLEQVKNFTVMIKNLVEFLDCGVKYQGRNLLKNCTECYLATCIFHPAIDPNCPIFRIGDIVEWSNEDFSKVAVKGGVFRIEINWNCDFDWGKTMQDCQPTYKFSRIGNSTDDQVAPGWSFHFITVNRSPFYHEENRRTLYTFYGLKILVEITGQGKKFNFLFLILNIGASIGFFAVAPLACDLLLDIFSQLKKICRCVKFFSAYSTKSRIQDTSYGGLEDNIGTEPKIWLTNYEMSKHSTRSNREEIKIDINKF